MQQPSTNNDRGVGEQTMINNKNTTINPFSHQADFSRQPLNINRSMEVLTMD